MPCPPSWDFVPLPQLGSKPLGAGGCPEAEGGKRRWCLIFQNDPLKTCCSLGLLVPQHPRKGLGSGPPQPSVNWGGEALLGPHPWRQRSLFPSSIPHRLKSPTSALDHSAGTGTRVPRDCGVPPAPNRPVPPSALFVFSACPAVITTRCHSLDNTSSLLSLLN